MIVVTAGGTVITVPTDPGGGATPGGPAGGGGAYQQLVDTSFLVTLTGADGTVWDLNNDPNVHLVEGVKLFGTPPVTHWWGSSAMVAGSRWRGVHYDNREPVLPILIEADDWKTWRDVDSAFFTSIIPEVESLITVTSPDGISRYLRARLVDDGDVADDSDPLLFARKAYVLQMASGQPLWEGDVITPAPFGSADPTVFFPGPPFHIAASTSSATATVTNPGHFPAWPRYTLTGPIPSFSVGVGDSLITSSTPIAAGRQVIIDSAPGNHTIVDQDGTRVFTDMTHADFAPIPPGVDVPIVVQVDGSSVGWSVAVEFTPLYRRPW